MASKEELFRPYLDEGIAALKDAGKRLGDGAEWYLGAVERIEEDATALLAALQIADEEKRELILKALATLIPDRKVFLLAAASAELGIQGQALVDVALDIGGRLIASAIKHFLI